MRRVVITLPAHNEESTIGAVLKSIAKTMRRVDQTDWQIVVVDDHSTDNTAAIARRRGATVITLARKSGLAEVFRQEMHAALRLNADWIVHIDSDGQHPPKAIPALLARLENGYELVVGSRFLQHRPIGKPRIEQFESCSFSHLLSWVTGQTLTDVHSGFRAFTRQVAQEIPIQSTFSYAREQLFRAACQGYKISEIPIVALPRKQGVSRLIKDRHRALLAVTGRFCQWSWQEKVALYKIPVILGWGVGTVAISWVLRMLHRAGISTPLTAPITPKA